MSEEEKQEEDMILDTGESSIIDAQINVLFNIEDMDHSGLYDDWNEQKIIVISRAMKIIAKSQNIILKNLK